jgi:RimJ/RimL family protein N-acetyltransferase
MDTFANEKDFKLLEQDKYTFFVLKRILGGDCQLILSDHSRLIICFSCSPFPVWIWTADDVNEDEMKKAYQLCMKHGFLDGTHRINLKYPLAEYFMKRAEAEGKKLEILTNMFAYDCPKHVEAPTPTDGYFALCVEEEREELAEFMDLMHREIGFDQQERSKYLVNADEAIKGKGTFFWKNKDGKNVASCDYRPNCELASIGLVFTRPEYRRHHYAENLVYQVAKIAKEKGFLPMLYTDADYKASNACYEKIGFILRGKLCTIGNPDHYE